MPLSFQKVDISSKKAQQQAANTIKKQNKDFKNSLEHRVRQSKNLNPYQEISALDLFKAAYKKKNDIILCFEYFTLDMIKISRDGEFGIQNNILEKKYIVYHFKTLLLKSRDEIQLLNLEEIRKQNIEFELFDFSYVNDPKGENSHDIVYDLETKIVNICRDKIKKAIETDIKEADKIVERYNSWAFEGESEGSEEILNEDGDISKETDKREIEDGLFTEIINSGRSKESQDVLITEIDAESVEIKEETTLQKEVCKETDIVIERREEKREESTTISQSSTVLSTSLSWKSVFRK